MRRLAAVFVALASTQLGHAQVVRPNDFYTANHSSTINHYRPSGAFAGSFSFNSYGADIRGMAYGPDELLYVTMGQGNNGFTVLGVDAAGTVRQTYSGPEYVGGNLSYGKVAFATNGQFFVAGQDDLRRFTIGNPGGTVVYTNNQVFDATALPSGNLLVLSAYRLEEITPDGVLVRTINPSIGLGDARGVAYDPAADEIYVTMIGYTDEFHQLMRLNGQTGLVDKQVTFTYGDDLFLTNDNRLLVGSTIQNPAFFDLNLNQIGNLGNGVQNFVAQATPVPEPSALAMLAIAALALQRRRRRQA